ncbi:hypothetical protein D9M72_451350 [compost metagenome]
MPEVICVILPSRLKSAVVVPHIVIGSGAVITGFANTFILKSAMEKHCVAVSNNLTKIVLVPTINGRDVFLFIALTLSRALSNVLK